MRIERREGLSTHCVHLSGKSVLNVILTVGVVPVLLTIFAKVIYNNNSTQQVRRCPVDDTVNSAQEDGQSLLVKADYDCGCGQLAWISLKFCFATVFKKKNLS